MNWIAPTATMIWRMTGKKQRPVESVTSLTREEAFNLVFFHIPFSLVVLAAIVMIGVSVVYAIKGCECSDPS